MSFVKITADRAIQLLEEVVAEHGEGTKNPKFNTFGSKYLNDDGSSSCIIAHALVKAGVPADVLRRADNNPMYAAIDAEEFSNYCTHNTLQIFRSAQSFADIGDTWGVALYRARVCYEYLKRKNLL